MIAASLTRSHKGHTLRLPEDARRKHRRYLIADVHVQNDHVVVMARDSHGRTLPMPIANGTPVEVTA